MIDILGKWKAAYLESSLLGKRVDRQNIKEVLGEEFVGFGEMELEFFEGGRLIIGNTLNDSDEAKTEGKWWFEGERLFHSDGSETGESFMGFDLDREMAELKIDENGMIKKNALVLTVVFGRCD